MKSSRAFFVVAMVASASFAIATGCSSSSDSTGTGSGTDSGTAADTGGGGGDGGGTGGGDGGHEAGTVVDSGGASSGFGASCTGPAGETGGCTDSVYNTCEMVGPSLVCTKTCTYPGGGGPQPSADCPNPPTSGDCTPKGFCK